MMATEATEATVGLAPPSWAPEGATVEAVGIEKSFGDVRVLAGVDVRVATGTVFALLGPNGAGKTTMVHILTTLLAPDAGRATVAGHDVGREPAAVKRSISLTGQNVAIDELLTGRENLVLMGRLLGLGRAGARARADDLLERFELTDAAGRRVRTWSGGMRRRLDLAIGLIAEPAVIFLDEPTTGLDPAARQLMWTVIESLVEGGTTIFLTTQYLEEADRLADQVAVLAGGTIIARGTPAELKAHIPGERVALGFADDGSWARALRAIGDARPGGGERGAPPIARHDRDRRTIDVTTGGRPAEVKDLLDLLDREGVVVDDLTLHRPTLDDVFLLLTGRPAGAPDGSDESGEGDDR
jgi:ABC-2 type transport system ATP-binding protein